jgi:glycosyltransferase involved in cell wall biosynthesis
MGSGSAELWGAESHTGLLMESAPADSPRVGRVLLVMPTFHPNLQGFMMSLADAGHDVQLLVTAHERTEIGSLIPPGTRTVGDSIVSRVSSALRKVRRRKPLRAWQRTPGVRSLWRALREYRPDIVVARSTRFGVIKTFALARLSRTTFVVYNLRALEWPQNMTPMQSALSLLMRALRIEAIPRMTPVSPRCEERHDGTLFSSWWVPFTAPHSEARGKDTYVPHGEIRLLFVGTLAKFKRIEYLLDAVHILIGMGHRATLTVVASQRSEKAAIYASELRVRADQLGVSEFVRWRFNVPHEDMWDTYRHHDAFVSLAREIGGMAMVEAMAAGTPVVVSNEIGVSSYLLIEEPKKPRGGAIVNGADSFALADVLRRWLEVPGTIAEKGDEARGLVQHHYLPAHAYRALSKMIDSRKAR